MERKLFGPSLKPTRRMVLRGAGATLFLPFLPSALPREAWGASGTAPARLVVCVVPNGIFTPAWQPLGTGANYDLPEIIAPLSAGLQPRFSILSGTQNLAEEAVYPNHDQAMGSILTDTPIEGLGGGGLENGISFDQVAADAFGANTPFRSMQLGVKNTGGFTGYNDKISWGNADTPYPPILDPRTAFARMFGEDNGMSEEEVAARKTVRSSILDRVLDRTTSMQTTLAAQDVQKLDQYQTAVRELELQIERLESIACVAPDEPDANPAFGEATSIMYDLMFKAFECDLTRYITFLQGPSVSGQVYSHLGLAKDDHSLSHNSWYDGNDVDRAARITMQNWQFQMFTDLMQDLANATDFDGNDILSNTLCVFTSEFGDANLHMAYGTYGQPMGIGGGENLGVVQGLHRALPEQSHANVWLGLLNLLGIEQSTFGTFGTTPVDLTI
jgi:hypothetical protein